MKLQNLNENVAAVIVLAISIIIVVLAIGLWNSARTDRLYSECVRVSNSPRGCFQALYTQAISIPDTNGNKD